MSFHFSPQIVTEGLVLCLDSANPKSYNTVNLALNSEAINLWGNNGNGILRTSNTVVAPDGTLTADTLAQTSATGISRWVSSTTRTYLAGVTYTLSIWLKKVSGNDPQPNIWLWVNGAYVLGGGNTVGPITNQWVRYTRTFTPATTISVNTFSGLAVGWNVNGVANDFVFAAWGFQIEVGTGATEYVPSTAIWKDLSRGGKNGELMNVPTYDSNYYGSIVFDGVNDYVNIGAVDLGIVRDFTVSFWANITKNGAVEIFNRGYILPAYGIYLAKLSTNKLTLQATNVGTVDTNATIVPGIANYVVTRNNTNCSWYINGVLDKSQTVLSGNISQSNLKEWRIGSNFDAPSRPTFGGNIYSLSVYNIGLTQQQILQNYNTTKTRFGL